MYSANYEFIEKIWNESSIVFDSSSIFRLYEWQIKKSLVLKDIFDCKSRNIWITEQIIKELNWIYNARLDTKRKKLTDTMKDVKNMNIQCGLLL